MTEDEKTLISFLSKKTINSVDDFKIDIIEEIQDINEVDEI
ncbi:MAG: hypothetical protein PHR25_03065 [Clostridia bacterium]|nr:hypothetical protein [Clostridia bacterium]